MLKLIIPLREDFDEETNTFLTPNSFDVELEHSLVSLSRWESVWEKPFLGDKEKSTEEIISYIRMMILTPDVPEAIFDRMISEHLSKITDYISAKMTATWFEKDSSSPKNREIITAEIIYYWMVSLNIPFECQFWHLNRLITLVRVINQKNAPKKKMNRRDAAAQRRALNAQRKSQYGTRG